MAVIHGAGGDTHRAFATEGALAVIQARALQVETSVGDHLTAAVIDPAFAVETELPRTGQGALLVVHAGGVEREPALAADKTTKVGQGALKPQIKHRQRAQRPATIVQGVTQNAGAILAMEQALGLVDDVRDRQPQIGPGQDLAVVAIAQLLSTYVECRCTGKLACAVINAVDVNSQRLAGTDQACVAVVERGAGKFQVTLSNQFTALLGKVAEVGDQVRIT
ncbi:hypothetical protein D3C77_158630 [compost metagenome]